MLNIYGKRKCFIDGDMCYIPLSSGKFAVCDANMFEEVSRYNWTHGQGNYPVTRMGDKTKRLHNFLVPSNLVVDHINGNPLDNRSCNLRECSQKENARNMSSHKDARIKYKGVSFEHGKNETKYRAQIKVNGKSICLGIFNTAEEAAKCYDENAIKYFGEYSRLNFGSNEGKNVAKKRHVAIDATRERWHKIVEDVLFLKHGERNENVDWRP